MLELPVARLATTLAPLRGPRTDPASALAPLPLRVAATGDGTYEVLDGFKRLAAWTGAGDTQVPVVVEDAPGVVGKARLLEANAPRRTLSPMDEARVCGRWPTRTSSPRSRSPSCSGGDAAGSTAA